MIDAMRATSPRPLRQQQWAGAPFLAFALFLAACGSVPKESFYTLSSAPPIETRAAMTAHVDLTALPDAVDRTPMVIRTGANQVDIDDFHRWAEPLKYAIPRVVAANLAHELGGARVTSGRRAPEGVDHRVSIDVTRFESSFSQGATLEASWTVKGKSGAPKVGRTLARVPAASADHSGVAAAHSRALEQLAREIAAATSR
jgi:uncharacterized lipoprotein YmbA